MVKNVSGYVIMYLLSNKGYKDNRVHPRVQNC